MDTRLMTPRFGSEMEMPASESHLLANQKARKIGALASIRAEKKAGLPAPESQPRPHRRRLEAEVLRHVVATPEAVVIPKLSRFRREARPATRNAERALHGIEQRPTLQLLKDAEALFINGVSVRQLYEANRIDRAGLIRIVKAGLGGNSVAEAFAQVEFGRERQRERAKEFRHDDTTFNPTATATQLASPIQPVTPAGQLNMPTEPDASQLQPLNQATTAPKTTTDRVPVANEQLPGPKHPYLSSVVVTALGLVTFVAWLLLG